MRQLGVPATWRAVGTATAQPSGTGLIIRLQAQRMKEVARLYLPLPSCVWELEVRVFLRLRLLDPWRETIACGVSDAVGEVLVQRQLTVDPMLSRVVVEKHCHRQAELFFSLTGPFASVRFYLDDITVEEKTPRRGQQLSGTLLGEPGRIQPHYTPL
ncbi:MAG: hypothetical protein NZ578_00130 [Candidatus Binatia bacterium]|nr:hypothetical protein [Candidatus Binatia bacterium]